MGNTWYLYLLIIVFLGGVIVLIIYICALSSNEKFSSLNKFGLTKMVIFSLLSLTISYYYINLVINISFVTPLYSSINYTCTIMLILYLLITIIVIVKLVKYEEGPLINRL